MLQSWKSCLEKAHQMLAASPGYVTQLLCALLQAQLVATDLGTCLTTLRQLQHSISRCSLNSQSLQLCTEPHLHYLEGHISSLDRLEVHTPALPQPQECGQDLQRIAPVIHDSMHPV